VLLALFGATMGQGVVWYTGQFYALSFIRKVCNVDFEQSNYIIAIALAAGTGLFIFFGWLSDKIGRKSIMLAGMLIAILTYRPIYSAMYNAADVTKKTEITEQTKVEEKAGLVEGKADSIYTTTTTKAFTDGTTYKEVKKVTVLADKTKEAPKPDVVKTTKLGSNSYWFLIFMVFIQLVYVTMVYGPIAAFLVEMFPVKIRYTSMSLPYHIGNGVFGGLLPAIATYLVTSAKDAGTPQPYLEGLWYPILIAGVCFVIGLLYINGKDTRIDD
jgi:MFS family permease